MKTCKQWWLVLFDIKNGMLKRFVNILLINIKSKIEMNSKMDSNK